MNSLIVNTSERGVIEDDPYGLDRLTCYSQDTAIKVISKAIVKDDEQTQ